MVTVRLNPETVAGLRIAAVAEEIPTVSAMARIVLENYVESYLEDHGGLESAVDQYRESQIQAVEEKIEELKNTLNMD